MKNLKKAVCERAVRFLDLKYCDLLGRLRHVTLPIERLNQAVADGVGFDSSSVAGFGSGGGNDLVLRPDLETAVVDPFAAIPTISCFADIYEPGDDRRFSRDPRFILQKAVALIENETGADCVMIRPELEFYLFNSAEFWTDEASSVYRVTTDELRHDDHTGLALFKGPAYHVAPPFDRSADFRSELTQLLVGCGIGVKYHHHEGGRFSQIEVELTYAPAVRAADGIILAKYLIRNLAFRSNKSATFMPKPIYNEPGSGMHLHQYLGKQGVSLFGDKRKADRLSRLARHYIGGILKHAPSLCALTNPSTNSYRRLVPGFEAPVLIFFSVADRSAAIRIPGYITTVQSMAIEFRVPDATANPYLALAAILLAGLDGIRTKSEPDVPQKGRPVPTTLREALAELRRNSGYLIRDGVFDQQTVEKWLELKSVEDDAVAKRPHPWEFNLYYGC